MKSRLNWQFLILSALAVLFVSCSKPAPQQQARMEKVEELRNGLNVDQVKQLASSRVEAKMKVGPQFDEDARAAELIYDRYRLKMEDFPKAPKELEQLKDEFRAFLDLETEAKFPTAKLEDFRRKAVTAYPLFEVGSQITVKTRRGSVTGIVRAVEFDRIKVDAQLILFRDMLSPTDQDFDEQFIERRRQHFLDRQFNTPRSQFRSDLMARRVGGAFAKDFFVRVNNRWIRADRLQETIFKAELAKMRHKFDAEMRGKYRAEVTAQLREEGFID